MTVVKDLGFNLRVARTLARQIASWWTFDVLGSSSQLGRGGSDHYDRLDFDAENESKVRHLRMFVVYLIMMDWRAMRVRTAF